MQAKRTRKKSSGISRGFIFPGVGVPPSVRLSVNKNYGIRIRICSTVSKRNNSIESIEYDRRINHFVIVQFTKILYFRKSPLVEFEVILFQTDSDPLEDVVDGSDHEVLMIPVKSTREYSEEVNTAILNLLWFAEYPLEYVNDLNDCK